MEKCLEFGVADQIELLDTPCDEVWKIVTDVDRWPRHFSGVRDVERIDGSSAGDPVAVGTKIRRTRVTKEGETIVADLVVTILNDGGDDEGTLPSRPRRFGWYAHNFFAGGAASLTWTVLELEGGGCRVSLAFAMMPKRAVAWLGSVACCCIYKSRSFEVIHGDLNDVAAICKYGDNNGSHM